MYKLIEELRNLRIDLSVFWGMGQILKNKKVHNFIISALKRKNWWDNDNNKLNLAGEEMYNKLLEIKNSPENFEIGTLKKEEKKVKKEIQEEFEEWWKIYPSTNNFVYQDVQFSGTQSKKKDKEKCFEHYQILRKDYSQKEMIDSITFHIEEAKKESLKENKNQITYIPNSERYLREERFVPYIEITKKMKEIGIKSNNRFKSNFEL